MRRLLVVAATTISLVALAGCVLLGSEDGAVTGGEPTGEIRVVEEGVADGPGVSIADALAADTTEPQLVNGILLMDASGVIWLCAELLDTSPPECAEPNLRVANFPRQDGTLDPANAAETGLQQDGDVVWIESYQLFGIAEPGL